MLTTQGAGPGASDAASATSDAIEPETSTPEGGGAAAGAAAAAAAAAAAVPPWSSSSPSSRSQRAIPLPSLASLSRTFDLFYERHFAVDFCSFDYRRHFDAQYEEKPFLVVSIISLCAQYLTPEEAWRDYGLSTGRHVWRRYLSLARSLAKELSDTPTVPNIQGYLVLALSELISSTGCSHWLYAGTAIRMAQMMRLNKEYQQRHSLHEQEMRRRTFWACFLMDRILAYFLSKPRTLSLGNIGVALPSTDVSVVYKEPTKGLSLGNLVTTRHSPSDVGLSPYFLKSACLWSDMADMNVCHQRFIDPLAPLDPKSLFFRRSKAVHDWSASLPAGLRWSVDNYTSQCGLGQGRLFVAMHLLLRSALCIAHQSYLPHLDGCSVLLDHLDAAGWSLLRREPALISTCVYSAMEMGEIAQQVLGLDLEDGQEPAREPHDHLGIQSTWLVCSLLPAANVFLWLYYAKDGDFAGEATRAAAKTYLDTIQSLLSRWRGRWGIAQEWLAGLRTMEVTYRAAYLGEVPPHAEIEELSPASHRDRDEGDPSSSAGGDYRPRPGDGCPPVSGASNLYHSLRIITTESAPIEDMQSVWLYLAGGWSNEMGDLLIPGVGVDPAYC
ncbi:hypothetical protein ACO1O0_006594 [Amphichorda felina]